MTSPAEAADLAIDVPPPNAVVKGRVKGLFYGWVVLAVAGLEAFFSGPGQTYNAAAFIPAYEREFRWTRSEVSSLYMAGTLCSASLQQQLGKNVDRYGPRFCTLVFTMLLSLGCAFNAMVVQGKATCAVGFFLVRLFGQGGLSLVPKTLVPRWFVRRRGLAMGILSTGWMASQALFPWLNALMIARRGWRFCWMVWSVALSLMLPAAYFLLVDHPEDMGLHPDGDTAPQQPPGSPSKNKQGTYPPEDSPVALHVGAAGVEEAIDSSQAVRTWDFWILAICQLQGALVHTAVTFYAFGIMSRSSAPAFIAARSAVGLPVNLLSGWLVDRAGPRRVMALGFAAQTAGLYAVVQQSPVMISGGLLGASTAMVSIAQSVTYPSTFGVAHLGAINGLFNTVGVFGSAVGPFVFGAIYDRTGSFRPALLASAAYAASCVVLALAVSRAPGPGART